jgi:hypothetical protein
MMSFYLLFLYADRPYYNARRTLCLCEYLFKIQQNNRLKKQGLLRRFSITCYGKQKTLEDIRTEKSKQFKKLKTKKKSKEYDKWFLRYNPELNIKNKPVSKPKKTKEDIINEAKLALEAKALTSKAVIAELEKINKMPDTKGKGKELLRSKMSSKMSKTLKSTSRSNYLSRLLTNRQKTLKNTKNNNKSNDKKHMSEEEMLFIQNEFTPSNMAVSLTDENLYKK